MRTQYITSVGLNYNVWGVTWRVILRQNGTCPTCSVV